MTKPQPEDQRSAHLLLGSILKNPDLFHEAASFLDAEDLPEGNYRALFRAMLYANEENSAPPDIVSVARALRELGDLDRLGGAAWLTKLTSGLPSEVDINGLTQAVLDEARRRQLKEKCESTKEALDEGKPTIEVVESMEEALFAIHGASAKKRFQRAQEGMAELLEATAANALGLEHKGLYTGYLGLDLLMGELQEADYVICGARPSVGKTAWGLGWALHAAMHQQKVVAIFSAEMERIRLWRRLTCMLAGVDSQQLKKGDLSQEEWARLATASARLHDLPIYIDDTSSITPMAIRAKCRRLQAEAGLDLVVIDYIQLLDTGSGDIELNANENQRLTYISKKLKEVAQELGVVLCVLSQLSRAPEHRKGGRPQMSDLRGSGAMEQDCDIGILLYRPDQADPTERNIGRGEAILRKNRDGGTGPTELTFIRHLSRYVNGRVRVFSA